MGADESIVLRPRATTGKLEVWQPLADLSGAKSPKVSLLR